MSDVITEARTLLQRRLHEVDHEKLRLERAMGALGSDRNGTAPARAKRGRPRKRQPGGRAKQALNLIAERPGITASEIAGVMKIKPNYLYRVLGDLEKQKRVKKKGRTYTAA
jgi:sugar-specific transcriptional regulator TrmB